MNSEFSDWNQLLGNGHPSSSCARVAIREQIERRAGLLEHGPEEGGREEQRADGIQAPALLRRPVAAEKQPAEEPDGDDQQQIAGAVRDLLRGNGDDAGVSAECRSATIDGQREPPHEQRATLQARRRLGRRSGRRMQAGVAEVLAAEHVLNHAEHHADAGRGETEVPVDALPEIPADQRRDERAEIDPHVEDRETGVAADVVLADRAARR